MLNTAAGAQGRPQHTRQRGVHASLLRYGPRMLYTPTPKPVTIIPLRKPFAMVFLCIIKFRKFNCVRLFLPTRDRFAWLDSFRAARRYKKYEFPGPWVISFNLISVANDFFLACSYLQEWKLCINALLDAGAPLNGPTCLWESSPLAVACQYGHHALLSLLLAR